MKKVTIPIDVYVLEESDIAEITSESFAEGRSQAGADALSESLPGSPPVQFGLRSDARLGNIGVVKISGRKLDVGDGIAFHPAFGVAKLDAILLLDAEEEANRQANAQPAAPEVADPAPSKAVAKKAVKKAAKKKV